MATSTAAILNRPECQSSAARTDVAPVAPAAQVPPDCPICLQPIHRPKFLLCLHAYCHLCVQTYYGTMAQRHQRHAPAAHGEAPAALIACPLCRVVTVIRSGVIDDLPDEPHKIKLNSDLNMADGPKTNVTYLHNYRLDPSAPALHQHQEPISDENYRDPDPPTPVVPSSSARTARANTPSRCRRESPPRSPYYGAPAASPARRETPVEFFVYSRQRRYPSYCRYLPGALSTGRNNLLEHLLLSGLVNQIF